ncbi:MAG: hypothetical protein LBV72_07140 [Tannerella sp.]|jgi:hypothetical protein|nr:hypothetical protein [Tannerella sp.]
MKRTLKNMAVATDKYKTLLWLPLLIVTGCSQHSVPLDLALNMAGENRPELEKVLAYYSSPEDSLKYRAACFLIENMPYHFSKIENYQSSDGEIYRPDISRFSSPEEVEAHCDSLILL